MVRRLLRWIFNTGNTSVEVPEDSRPLQEPWWRSNPISEHGESLGLVSDSERLRDDVAKFDSTEPQTASDTDLEFELILVSSLTPDERGALIHLVGDTMVERLPLINKGQREILRRFARDRDTVHHFEYWLGKFQVAGTIPSFRQETNRKDESYRPNAHVSDFQESIAEKRVPHSESISDRFIQHSKNAQTILRDSKVSEEPLNAEQQRVFDYIENTSGNVLITGRAGAGKSFLLRYLLEHSHSRILPVAFMGIAALNIGGSTIHSAFKLPLQLLLPTTGTFAAERLSEEGRTHYREFRMLVVDEISMVAADQFVAMDMFLRSVNENDEPFGGVQVVLFGDPYQLPPVVVRQTEAEFYSDNWGGPYFFNTSSWRDGSFLKVELQGSERQSDKSFLNLLDAMRIGELSTDQWEALHSRVVPEEDLPISGAVRIAPKNELADKYNDMRLRQLPGTSYLFHGEATGEYRKNWKRLPAPMKLSLKQGAQVIMVKNDMGRRWVNGSLGRISEVSQRLIRVEIDGLSYDVDVADWDKETHTYDRARKALETDAYSRYRQYPIALGWARTIHKSQGQTFEKCIVDLRSRMFGAGQAYVACSRTKSLEALYFNAPLTPSSVMTSDTIRTFMSDLVTPKQLPRL